MNSIERIVRRVDAYQQRHGSLAFVFGVIKKFGDDRGSALAALVAYYGFLALFPLLLLLTTILGFVLRHDPGFERAVLNSALKDFPIIGTQLASSIRPLRGSSVALVVGIGGSLWGSLGVTQAGQLAMAEVWNVPGVVRPNLVHRLTRGLGLLAVLSAGVLGTTVLASLSTFGQTSALVKLMGAVASVGLNVAIYIFAFRVLTVSAIPTRALVPGAILGGLAWSVLQAFGSYLVIYQLRQANQVYGYFASVLGLVSWLYVGAQISLYAAELNVVRARRLWPRSIVQPPLTDADKRTFDHIAVEGERRPEQSVTSSWEKESPSPEEPESKTPTL